MMFALHPPSLAVDGLVQALDDYLDGFIAPAGVGTVVRGDRSRRSTPATEALAFRLARSAIRNAWVHASAGEIAVTVDLDDHGVRVTVRDDGVGFDATGPHPAEVGHAGIEYSRELAAEVGGIYEVTSTPGAGTTVTIAHPVV